VASIASANARLEHRAQHGSSTPRVRAATRARVDARAVSHGRATTWCARTTRRDDANDGDDGDDANDGARAARRRARDDDGATMGRRG
jgi:hypothetical protein